MAAGDEKTLPHIMDRVIVLFKASAHLLNARVCDTLSWRATWLIRSLWITVALQHRTIHRFRL